MKPGQVIKKFVSKKDKEIILRYAKLSDAKDLMVAFNSVVDEGKYLRFAMKVSLAYERKWLKEAINEKVLMIIATHRNKIIGNCLIKKKASVEDHIGKFGILIIKEYREEGIGTIISRKTIEDARKSLNLKMITLEAFEDNKRAISLYKKIGFKKYGRLPKGMKIRGKYMNRIMMYKEL